MSSTDANFNAGFEVLEKARRAVSASGRADDSETFVEEVTQLLLAQLIAEIRAATQRG
jgi:hypothetical protein